jgi:hypothetical protein
VLCPYCGHYKVDGQTYKWMREHAEEPLFRSLAARIRQSGEPPIITKENWRPMALAAESTSVDQRTTKLLDFFRNRSRFQGMSLRLLKFGGGSVDDYAICRSS